MAGRPIYAHVWAAISMRAMPENEIPPALPGDDYYTHRRAAGGIAAERAMFMALTFSSALKLFSRMALRFRVR